MSAPVQPDRPFDPSNVADWINVLHNANAVPKDAPDYNEARAVAAQAWAKIGHLNRSANAIDRNAAVKGPANVVASGLGSLAHGASMGLGEPIAGVVDAMGGGSFREGAQRYREGLDRLQESNPNVAATAELAGMLAPAAPATTAFQGITAGVPLGVRSVAGRLATGAGTGAVMGGVSGFSAGGDDPGSLRQRIEAGKRGAVMGGATGAVLTGLGLRAARGQVERDAALSARGATQRTALANERIAGLREQRLQQKLQQQVPEDRPLQTPLQGVTEPPPRPPISSDVQAAVADFEAGKISGEDLRTAMDFANGRLPREDQPLTRGSLSLLRSEDVGAPQGPPSPPVGGSSSRTDFWDQANPNVHAPNLAAREKLFGAPDKPFTELYGDVVQPPMGRPNPLLSEDALLRPQRSAPAGRFEKAQELYPDAEGSIQAARVVEPGPYQRAPKPTRMESPREASHMTSVLASDTELLKSQYELAQAFGGVNPRQLAEIAQELERRGVNVRRGGLTPEASE